MDSAPDVHGEDGGRGVEDGGEGGDEGGHHDGQHQASQPRRHQLQHQGRVGDVGAPGTAPAVLLALVRVRAADDVCGEKGGRLILHWYLSSYVLSVIVHPVVSLSVALLPACS